MMQLDKEDLKAWAEAEENLCDKFHLDLEELIKILDYCFGGRNKKV
jgi:hypothetical protein